MENQELLKKATPVLAKRFDFTKRQVEGFLENQNGSLDRLLLRRSDPKTRQEVNKWWKENRAKFSLLGLGILKRIPSPSKLPEITYDQLICLVWLTEKLRSEQLIRERKQRVELVKRGPTFWQRILDCFKNLLKRRKKNESAGSR